MFVLQYVLFLLKNFYLVELYYSADYNLPNKAREGPTSSPQFGITWLMVIRAAIPIDLFLPFKERNL